MYKMQNNYYSVYRFTTTAASLVFTEQ